MGKEEGRAARGHQEIPAPRAAVSWVPRHPSAHQAPLCSRASPSFSGGIICVEVTAEAVGVMNSPTKRCRKRKPCRSYSGRVC